VDIKISFPAPEPSFDYKLLFDLAPHLLWACIILGVLAMIGPKRIAEAILKARKISFAGVEIDLKSDIAEAVQAKGFDVLSQLEGQVARRVQRSLALTRGARLLWIDENPLNNATETQLLKRLGISVDRAKTDADAERALASGAYDIVLSSMTRGGNAEAGITFLPKVLANDLSLPLIFYVGKKRPIPEGAFGLTIRPDELINLILDALERARG
jgi:CheY-like chemotaxis protein